MDCVPGEENVPTDIIDSENTDIRLELTKPNRGKINFIDDRMLASMDKCKLSTRDAMHLVSATVAAFVNKLQEVNGGKLPIQMEDLVLNRTTVHSMRKKFRRRQAEEIIDGFNVINLYF